MTDNRQFTDHNEIGGVNVYLEDKKLSEKTSKSSVASTDFVLLEDTDGAYHKIAKASFVEAIRAALGSAINSVQKGTDIAKMPVLDSNNDLGMGTIVNVGKALGVYRHRFDANETFTIPKSRYGCFIYYSDTSNGTSEILPCTYYLPFDITQNYYNIKRTTAGGDVTMTAQNGGWAICIPVEI